MRQALIASAFRFRGTGPMDYRFTLAVVLGSLAPCCAQAGPCTPAPEIRAELQKAAAIPVINAFDFDRNVAHFRELRQRHPDDLFAHEAYQDAVNRFGIEGHLQALTGDYESLSLKHYGELMYRYLYARSLLGRNTRGAIQALSGIAAEDPNFAPAHRALAEAYGTDLFQDAAQQKTERDKFLQMCPGETLLVRPPPLPDRSPLIEQAELLLAQNGDLDRALALATQGIQNDEWRLQRMRPFDWYSAGYKRQEKRELLTQYWRLWRLQVRCYRKLGQPEQAAALLSRMERSAESFRKTSNSAYWDSLETLARLYAEGNQPQMAAAKLDTMRSFLAEHPNPAHAAQFEDLCKQLASSNRLPNADEVTTK